MGVKVYTTSNCKFCDLAKDFLKKNDIEFEEVDVKRNARAAKEALTKSGQPGVPVIDVDGKIIVGFDRPALKRALKIE